MEKTGTGPRPHDHELLAVLNERHAIAHERLAAARQRHSGRDLSKPAQFADDLEEIAKYLRELQPLDDRWEALPADVKRKLLE